MVSDVAEAIGHIIKDLILKALEPVFCFVARGLIFVLTLGQVRITHNSCERYIILPLLGFALLFSITLYIFYLFNN